MHIFAGENDDVVIRTRAHEKIQLDFLSAEPLYVLYIAGKNVKNCKVRSCLCALDPSIFHFIWAKYGGKIWQLEPSNLICKKMEMAWKLEIVQIVQYKPVSVMHIVQCRSGGSGGFIRRELC